MGGETITRARLSEAVYQEVGLSRNESAELVESVISEISGALERGEMVKISSFGSFAPAEGKTRRPQSQDRPGSADQPAARSRLSLVPRPEGSDQPWSGTTGQQQEAKGRSGSEDVIGLKTSGTGCTASGASL